MSRLLQKTRLLVAVVTTLFWLGGLNASAFQLLGCAQAKAPCCPCCHKDGSCSMPACAFSQDAGQPAATSPEADLISRAAPVFSFAAVMPGETIGPRPVLAAATPQSADPPGQVSFAEQVLQESLFAHAPPAV